MSEIEQFLQADTFAVVGASNNRDKYGNKVLRAYLQNEMSVVPIHPRETLIEGQQAYSSLKESPAVEAISIITPPAVTESIVETAIDTGVKQIWMQPGAESQAAIDRASEAGIHVIAGGPCILVALRFRDDFEVATNPKSSTRTKTLCRVTTQDQSLRPDAIVTAAGERVLRGSPLIHCGPESQLLCVAFAIKDAP